MYTSILIKYYDSFATRILIDLCFRSFKILTRVNSTSEKEKVKIQSGTKKLLSRY